MYICSCNPFTDKAVKEFLGRKDGRSTVAEVYSHCTGGEKPGCCTCLKTLKDMVTGHNAACGKDAAAGCPRKRRAA